MITIRFGPEIINHEMTMAATHFISNMKLSLLFFFGNCAFLGGGEGVIVLTCNKSDDSKYAIDILSNSCFGNLAFISCRVE